MPNPTAAMLVIGNEILSGRTRDANMHFLAGKLTEIGIRLMEARVVPDIEATIIHSKKRRRVPTGVINAVSACISRCSAIMASVVPSKGSAALVV